MTFLPALNGLLPSLGIRRFYSFIGKQAILIDPGVKLDISPIIGDSSKTFKRTEYATLVSMDGPLGSASFPVIRGLVVTHKSNPTLDSNAIDNADASSVASSSEQELSIALNLDSSFIGYKLTKYQEKFVKSMWGTTQKLLSNLAIGITEVGVFSLITLLGT